MNEPLQLQRFDQPAGRFYFTCMPAAEIARVATAEPRSYDPSRMESVGGLQRPTSAERVREIAEYCSTLDAAFPTPIILAVPKRNYVIGENESTVTFKGDPPFANVVDGQHRLEGLKASKALEQFVLPVVLLLDATMEQQALLFATINGKQNKVPASHVFDLFEVSRTRSPQKSAHEIARALNSNSDSPWHARMKMLGRKSVPGSVETLTQGTFVRYLMRHLSRHPSRDYDASRRNEPFEEDDRPVLRQYFVRDEDESIVKILTNIFNAQRRVWPAEWEDSRTSILSKTTGFMATMWTLERLVRHGQEARDLTQVHFGLVFAAAAERVAADGLELDADSFPSSAQGIRKLQRYFEAAANTVAAMPAP